jgi:hypothetical protein
VPSALHSLIPFIPQAARLPFRFTDETTEAQEDQVIYQATEEVSRGAGVGNQPDLKIVWSLFGVCYLRRTRGPDRTRCHQWVD